MRRQVAGRRAAAHPRREERKGGIPPTALVLADWQRRCTARCSLRSPAGQPVAPRPTGTDFALEDGGVNVCRMLRTEAGRAPYDRTLQDLVGELATQSVEFRARWAAHNVRLHRTGVKQFRHPVVGNLDLLFEAMALEADEGLTLTALSAEPGTPSRDALKLLESWSATVDQEQWARAADRPV